MEGTTGIVQPCSTEPRYGLMLPQPFEVLRAIERKDIMYLMEVRDRSFKVYILYINNISNK